MVVKSEKVKGRVVKSTPFGDVVVKKCVHSTIFGDILINDYEFKD